ncbi:DUF222 domain-containing protein [Yimella sp. cx-51]|uniref:DUF222 domain-containing protein n=1 Tax=Yimella sp. cx-51 TaxID=2770551 RepID=UPI00165D68EA|nr:DUF222 domain-containing protein [Yimella sp. cx-51]MBC9957626.1 DUF222 domain-containing protein [Yimella sp. cx-51]QTH37015.1 DUF222 domain-containing protein [Yimella sp. cx-51]
MPSRERGRGGADQIALARRITPSQASRDLGFACALSTDLPGAGDLLSHGRISERAAQAVHRESDHLDPGLRRELDSDLAPVLPKASVRGAANATRGAALSLDPDGATKRATKAAADRAAWFKPAKDGMCKIVAFLPAAQGLSAFQTLKRDVGTAMATGDIDGGINGRTRSQLTADLFTERLTGASVAKSTPVEVQLFMPTEQVFGDQASAAAPTHSTAHPAFGVRAHSDVADVDGPSWLAGYGPILAAIARGIIAGAGDLLPPPAVLDQAQAWLRRVFVDPVTGHVSDIDSRRRIFDGTLRRFITIRDQICRTPGCDAPIRDIDHVQRHRDDGTTSTENGVGVCQRFNLVREMPGWTTEVVHGAGPPGAHPHTMRIATPTGKTYYSTAPPVRGGSIKRSREPGVLEDQLGRALDLYWPAA